MKQDGMQLESIDLSQLSDVTGGGLLGGAWKLARKAGPLLKKAGPYVKKATIESAKWTGVPMGLGIGGAVLEDRLRHH